MVRGILNFANCLIFYVSATALLGGCASTAPKYIESSTADETARLQGVLSTGASRGESVSIFVKNGELCRGSMFSLPKSDAYRQILFVNARETTLTDSIRIAAFKPMGFKYEEIASGGRSCTIEFDAVLLPGRSYQLKGGMSYKDGRIIPFLVQRGCAVQIVDSESGESVHLRDIKQRPDCDTK